MDSQMQAHLDMTEELEVLDPKAPQPASRVEYPTPHKVAVMILVQQYLKARQMHTESGLVFPTLSRRNFCHLLIKLAMHPDATYDELYLLLISEKYRIDKSHLSLFEKVMSDLFANGVDILFDFAVLRNIDKMLDEDKGVSQFSFIGFYIRRVACVLERLNFREMMKMHKLICNYYAQGVRNIAYYHTSPKPKSKAQSRTLTTDDTLADCDVTLDLAKADVKTMQKEKKAAAKWSPRQSEMFMLQQTKLIETNERLAMHPVRLQANLIEIILDDQLNTQAHFLWYLNCIRVNDFFGATQSLHRSFDRCPTLMMLSSANRGFQYFTINLATLHYHFGHREEARKALKECIMLAQEAGDRKCLKLASAWTCVVNLGNTNPKSRPFPDSRDPILIHTVATAAQFVSKFGNHCGYAPHELFRLMQKSEEQPGSGMVHGHLFEVLALRSALWCLFGQYELSSLYAQQLLNIRKVFPYGDVSNTEGVSKVMAYMILWLSIQGEYQLSALVSQHAHQRFPRLPKKLAIAQAESLGTVHHAMFSCCLEDALAACSQVYLIDKHAGDLNRAIVYVARGSLKDALVLLSRLQSTSIADALTRVRTLVLLAYATMSDNRLAAEAIEILMQANDLAEAANLNYECALVDMTLAVVLLEMDQPRKAMQAIMKCWHKICTNGGVYERAKSHFIFVKCLVGSADSPEDRRDRIMRAHDTLVDAAQLFRKAEAHPKVLDVYAYMIELYTEVEEFDLRNKYANLFHQYCCDFPIAQDFMGLAY